MADTLTFTDKFALRVDDSSHKQFADHINDTGTAKTDRFVPGSPTTLYVGSMVSLSMVHASIAPSVARIPQLISPPSNAGPAEQAQLIIKSEFPKRAHRWYQGR